MIRELTTADVAEVQRLAETHLKKWYGGQFRAVQDWITTAGYKLAWVYEPKPGQIGGFAVVSDKPEKDYMKLASMFVDKPYREHGVGHLLLQKAIDHARTTRNSKLVLTVAEDNGITKAFFEHAGFELIGRLNERYRPGKDELVYCLQLRS